MLVSLIKMAAASARIYESVFTSPRVDGTSDGNSDGAANNLYHDMSEPCAIKARRVVLSYLHAF
jgi:hypothetical protein